MKNEQNAPCGAYIERGKITAIEENTYTVESYDRPGVTAWELKSMTDGLHVGDGVYFFVFRDGSGLVMRTI